MAEFDLAERGRKVREALEESGRHKGQPFAPSVRELIMDYLDEGRAAGRSWQELADRVGENVKTVQHWPRRRPQGGLVRVKIAPAAAEVTGLVVIVGAVRIEGVSVAQAVELARALG